MHGLRRRDRREKTRSPALDSLLHFLSGEFRKEPLDFGAGFRGIRGIKIKRLRLWLCSSCPLLRGSKTTRMHVPSQPLMRSPLSRFQTPTAPRRAVGFFRSGSPPSCPGFLITQLTSDWPRFILGQPFQPSTGVKVNVRLKNVNAAIQCNVWIKRCESHSLQPADSLKLAENKMN